MGLLICAGVIACVAFALLICGGLLEKEGEDFRRNCRVAKAEVVGYDRSYERGSTLLVRIPERNDGKIYSCIVGSSLLETYPKGTMVDILYAAKKTMGIYVLQVQLRDDPPRDHGKTGHAMKKVSIAMLFIVVVLVVVGIAVSLFERSVILGLKEVLFSWESPA